MPSLGPAEILVILVVALLVFGPNKMPEIARQVGKGFREFRRVQQHLKSELRDVVSEFDSPTSAATAGDPVPTLPPKDDAATDATALPIAPESQLPLADAPAPAADAPVIDVASPPPVGGTPTPSASPEPDAPSTPA